jgi:hypothetical protein
VRDATNTGMKLMSAWDSSETAIFFSRRLPHAPAVCLRLNRPPETRLQPRLLACRLLTTSNISPIGPTRTRLSDRRHDFSRRNNTTALSCPSPWDLRDGDHRESSVPHIIRQLYATLPHFT